MEVRSSSMFLPNGSVQYNKEHLPKTTPLYYRSLRVRNKVTLTILGLVGIFFIITSRGMLRMISEFGVQRNFNPRIFEDYDRDSSKEYGEVPKTLHQIFFNVSERSAQFWEKYRHFRDTWVELNPDYEYILWNETMVTELILTHYPNIKSTYEKYETRFNIQTDIARYLIVHHMGGVYIDLDIKCKGSVKQIYDQMGSKTIALNFTFNPIGMATDFFIASRHHKFLEHVIDGLPDADVTYFTPYFNALLKTGPLFLFGRYLNYPYKDEVYSIPVDLIHSLTDRSQFGRSWHEVDGIIISFIWDVFGRSVFFVPLIIVFLVKMYQYSSTRQNNYKSNVHIA